MHNYLETLPFWKELTDDQKQLLSTHIIERSFQRGHSQSRQSGMHRSGNDGKRTGTYFHDVTAGE